MSVQPLELVPLEELSVDEQSALRSAATWYFKRHARIIAEEADDRSALAVTRREDFLELHSALWKLGIQLALPDELRPTSPGSSA